MKKIFSSLFFWLLAASAYCQDIDYTLRASYSYSDSLWNDNLRSTYSYENDNLILIYSEYLFPDSLNWSPIARTLNEYNTDGTMSESRQEDWNETTTLWEVNFRTTYEYNASGSIHVETRENRIDEEWIPVVKNENLYDPTNILNEVYFFLWDTLTHDWLLKSRNLYSYYPDGNISNVVREKYQNAQWIYQGEKNYTYTDFGKISEIASPVDTAADGSISGDRTLYTYDAKENLVYQVQEWIFATTQEWRPAFQFYYTNNEDGSLQSYIRQANMGLESPQWVNFGKNSYFYLQPNFIPLREPLEVALYPNPSSDMVYIQTSEKFEPVYYAILTMEGKTILSGSLTSGNQAISTASLASGIYLLELRVGDKIGISKLVKE